MFVENKEFTGDTVTSSAVTPVENTIMANFRKMVNHPLVAQLRKPGKVVMAEIVPPKTHEITFRKLHAHGKHDAAVYGRLIAVCHASNHVRLHHKEEGLDKIFSHTDLIHLVRNGQTHRVQLQFSERQKVSICRGDLQHFLDKAGLLHRTPATA
jgi:exosome complex RNA-binding protein Csl4